MNTKRGRETPLNSFNPISAQLNRLSKNLSVKPIESGSSPSSEKTPIVSADSQIPRSKLESQLLKEIWIPSRSPRNDKREKLLRPDNHRMPSTCTKRNSLKISVSHFQISSQTQK